MNRVEKKCVIVSTGLHLSLLGLILVGPAFTSSTTPEVRMIDFMPSMVMAENVPPGGGNPNAQPPAAITPPPQPVAQPSPQPKPEPRTSPKPEPEKELPRNDPPDPNDFTDKKKMPEIITKAQTRRRPPTSKPENSAATEKEARKAADARRALARAIADTAAGIREGSASATAIDEDKGPGGDGPAYAGYDSLVQMVYQSAWVKPSDTTKDAPVTYATVTIARDGTVVPGSARIITRSGDEQMDSSVERVLQRVTTVGRPFPEGIKEKQRVYKIRFDITKRSLT